jgi:tetratricopeptide (TPR) repeat protein
MKRGNMYRMRQFFFLSLLAPAVFSLLFSGACSSAPERPTEIFTNRNIAANQLDMANRTANQGRYQDALIVLEEARRLAISADDPALRIKTSISRGNIYFSMGRHNDAFLDWESAVAEGEAAGERDLIALAQIYIARGRLLLGSLDGYAEFPVEEIRALVQRQISAIKDDDQATATGWMVMGMAEKELGRFPEAESAARRALNIHEKNRFLEEAAYDWYLIASIRSVSEQYAAAQTALRTAINFDRRAENGFGLASSWLAMGEVCLKAEQKDEAADAFSRAAEIYRSLGLNDAAARAEGRIE